MAKKQSFLESFIVVMIIAAIIQIFLEDLSRIGSWSIAARRSLIIIGFLLDLIFTIEFIIRSLLSGKSKGWVNYFMNEKGWVDFFSAVPLLIFNSGPLMIGMFKPGVLIALPFMGILNILKVTKILRIARMLRLLRVLKIFKPTSLEAEEKRTAQLSKIISISIVTITLILIISPLLPTLFYNTDNNIAVKRQKYVNIIQDWRNSIIKRDENRLNYLTTVLKEDKNVLFMYTMGTEINNLKEKGKPAKVIPQKYFYTDFKVLNYMGFKLWYSVKDEVIDSSKINLLMTIIIVVLILAFVIFYTDPAMKK